MTAGLNQRIIGAAMRVHSALGPGLLESVYETCLAWELRNEGLAVEVQKALPLRYRGIYLDTGFRLDLAVELSVLVELKSVQRLDPIHAAQTMTYLKLSGYQSALLFNFNSIHLRDGIRRFTPRPNAPEHNLPSSLPPCPFRSSKSPSALVSSTRAPNVRGPRRIRNNGIACGRMNCYKHSGALVATGSFSVVWVSRTSSRK